MNWTLERARQLKQLEDVLRAIRDINHCSGFIDNITKASEICRQLLPCTIEQKSFIDFLKDECIADREKDNQ